MRFTDRARDLFTTRRPWLDLVYLSFFFFHWTIAPPDLLEAGLGFAALGLFIGVYIFTMRRLDWTVLVGAGLGMALALLIAAENWSAAVFMVFSAPMIARLPDAALRTPALVILGPVIILASWLAGMPWWWIAAVLVLAALSALSAGAAARRAEREADAEDREAEATRLGAEAERARIARDLHDLLGHTLSVITLKADLAVRLFEQDPARAKAELDSIQSISRDALGEVREAVTGLKARSLKAAWQETRARLVEAGLTVEDEYAETPLGTDAELALAMALREGVTNILRHSGAKTVHIRLESSADAVTLSLDDDGIGGAIRSGGGLSGLSDRLAAVGGRLDIEQPGNGGTRLRASVPAATGDAP